MGVFFRYLFMLFLVVFTMVLMWIKLQGEFITPPGTEEGGHDQEADDVVSQYLNAINKEREKREEGETRKQKKIRRKKEQQQVKEAHEEFQKKMESPQCDAACRQEGQQIQVLHDQVSSVVLTDYYEVMDIKTGEWVGKRKLREKFNTMKERIERKDPEVEHLDLQELQEAYATLENNEARAYFNLYGRKPPESMRFHAAGARDGGSGIQIATSTFKVKKLLAWLEFFNSKYLDIGVLAVFVLISVMPVILNFRQLIRTMKDAFPDLDPDNAEQHEERMEALRQATYKMPRRARC